MSTIPQLRFYQGNDWERLSDDTLIDVFQTLYCKTFHIDIEQFSLTQEFAERVEALVLKKDRTWDEINELTDELATKYDLPYGMALPGMNSDSSQLHDTVLAQGTPLSHIGVIARLTESAQTLANEGHVVRNSWNVLNDRTVTIVNTEDKGPMALWDYHSGIRLQKFLKGVTSRMDSQMTVEAEEQAMALLKTKITNSQYRCYVLNGVFPEKSKRSDLHYIFRKGLPVMALSWHGKYKDGGKVLAYLCLHPYGYYQNTHAGVMTPTDEVIAQLLLMRADERKFWAKSGQWRGGDTRSGM